MLNVYFTVNNDGTLKVSAYPTEQAYRRRINITGDFFKNLRKKNNLTRLQTAKLIGYSNINKTIKNLTAIEEESKLFTGYTEKLLSIFNIPIEEFLEIKRIHEQTQKEYNDNFRKEKTKFYKKLIDNLPPLLSVFFEIMDNPQYYFIPMYDSSIYSSIIGRKRNRLFLGELLILWKNRSWIGTCCECGKELYVTNAGGSPLSGAGSASGFCPSCNNMTKAEETFGYFFRPVFDLPVRKVPEGIEPITIERMIERLKC